MRLPLVLKGKEISRKTLDNGQDSDYSKDKSIWVKGGHPFDGGNSSQLENPPFTFENITWAKGELKAIGYKDSKEVCDYTVKTAETPSKLSITYFESGKPAEKNDLLIVYVKVKIQMEHYA